MRTPALNSKFLTALPMFISLGTACTLFYFYSEFIDYFSPLMVGIISGGLVDLDNGLTGKLKNITFTLLAFTISSLSVQLTINYPILLTITLTLLGFLFTLIGVAGLRYRTIAFGTLSVAVYTAMTHNLTPNAYTHTVFLIIGTLLYSGTTILIHLLFPHRPVQENTATAYDALSGYLDAKADFFDPDEADFLEPQQIKLAMSNAQVINAFNQCRHSLFYRMRGQHRHPRTTKMLRYYFVAQDIHERISSSHVHYQAFAEQMRHSDLIYRIQRLLHLQAQACREFAASLRNNDDAYNYSPQLDRATKGAEQSLLYYATHPYENGIAPYRVQRLLDNITHVSLQFNHLGNPHSEDLGEGDRIRLSSPDISGFKGAWRILKGQITPQSPVFRHAVRIGIIILTSCVLLQFSPQMKAYLLPDNVEDQFHLGFWILLTGIFVCQPNYSATKKRLIQRIFGTVLGVAVGSLLPLSVDLPIKLGIAATTSMLFFYFRTNKHSFSTFFITIQAIISFSIMGHDVTQFLIPRIADTVIGALIAGSAVYFIWPDWKYLSLEKTGAQAVQGNAGYLKAILTELHEHDFSDNITYRHARRISHDRAAALSSTLSDMSGEPKKYGSRIQDAFFLLKINYSLISYISALGAYRNKMHCSCEEEERFLKGFFTTAEQLVGIMENIDSANEEQFRQDLLMLQNNLTDLRPDFVLENTIGDDSQSQVLWQQLVMIADVLQPYYDALHREMKKTEPPQSSNNSKPNKTPTLSETTTTV